MELSSFILKKLYFSEKKSAFEISKLFNCSENKINYWLKRCSIPKRSISEAIYVKHNPKGDPFKIKKRLTKEEMKLFGFGLGLYWGEGNKRNKTSIRLSNTDPALIKNFIKFLVRIYGVKKQDINFSLLIFSDISPIIAKKFWIRELKIKPNQIRGKIFVIKSGSIGTYRQKSKYGVLILMYHNRKLRDIICNMIEELK